jgi:hypothetical protein
MWRSLVARILLVVSLFMSAPRPTFWRDVSQLRYGELSDDEVCESIYSVPGHYAGTFTEFYCNASTGSNVNGGSDAGSPSMGDTAGTGAYTTVTHQYTSVITSGAVTVGQFISIYSGAATVAAFTSRITAVSGGSGSAWVITCSTTAASGAEPTTGATYKANVGGALLGPNGASGFPFGYITNAQTDVAGDFPRVNFIAGTTYAITAAIAHNILGPVTFQGYTATPGDGGKFILDGGTSGVSFALLTLGNSASIGGRVLADAILQNNGATGSAAGLTMAGASDGLRRVVVNSVRGTGFFNNGTFCNLSECEAYGCNQSNTANSAGFVNSNINTNQLVRCYSHNNAGSNTDGFYSQRSFFANLCIADTNGRSGFRVADDFGICLFSCDTYNNAGDGVLAASSGTGPYNVYLENCNFVKNGGYGFNGGSAGNVNGEIRNCGFGSGTQANTSGQTNNLRGIEVTNSITYASGVTPWVSPATGNFSINLPAAENTGRGSFTQTGNSKTGTVGYPDVGAAQHQAAPIGQIVGARSIGTY